MLAVAFPFWPAWGRSTDFVTAADGTVLHGLALIYVLRDMPEVEEFRIVQETLLHTRVEVVTHSKDKRDIEEIVQNQFRQRLGAAVKISIDFVAAIPREKSGKFRYVIISKVGPDRGTTQDEGPGNARYRSHHTGSGFPDIVAALHRFAGGPGSAI